MEKPESMTPIQQTAKLHQIESFLVIEGIFPAKGGFCYMQPIALKYYLAILPLGIFLENAGIMKGHYVNTSRVDAR